MSLIGRLRTYKTAWVSYGSGYDNWSSEETIECPLKEATLIGSKLVGSSDHLPVVDIDLEIEIRPSKTAGHYHLIIDKPMSWRKYKALLKALAKAGVADPEWVQATIYSRQGFIAR